MKQVLRAECGGAAAAGLAAALGLLTMISPAQGQYQADTSGRALDANPQVGGSGYNAAENQIDYSLRNDVVTGNVGGGRQFRGEVGYSAPGEFQGNLGSDNLFRFRAESLSSDPRRLNNVQLYDAYSSGGGTSIYRQYTSLPSTRPLNAPSRTGTSIALPGYSFAPGELLGGDLVGGISDPTPTAPLAVLQDERGRILEVNASPLLGVRVGEAGPAGQPLYLPFQQAQEEADEALRPETMQDELDPTLRQPDQRVETGLETGLETRADAQARRQAGQADAVQAAQIAPALVLGEQLRQTPEQQDDSRTDEATQQRLNRLEQALFGQEDQDQAEVETDPYLRLLQMARQEEAQLRGEQLDETDLAELRQPSEDRLIQAQAARRQALERARQEAQERRRAQTTQRLQEQLRGDEELSEEDRQTQQTQRQELAEAEALSRLMERLEYDVPALETLAGARETRTDESLRRAERAMQSGEYFAAESAYRQVLREDSERPLARVGLIHAQLGAGLIRSAAQNMRTLFEYHPELIAARYGANLLPAQERLEFIQQELERMVDEAVPGASAAALMLAYLGHQSATPALTQYGLDMAESFSPRDALIPVLRRIWLGQEQGQDQLEESAPAGESAGQNGAAGRAPVGK